jgi:hypothetical protein
MKKSTKNYELRIYPMDPKGTRKVRVTYMVPNNWSITNTSVTIPLEILKTTANKISSVKIITWKNTGGKIQIHRVLEIHLQPIISW